MSGLTIRDGTEIVPLLTAVMACAIKSMHSLIDRRSRTWAASTTSKCTGSSACGCSPCSRQHEQRYLRAIGRRAIYPLYSRTEIRCRSLVNVQEFLGVQVHQRKPGALDLDL